ncbi:SIMPL domain-containing protein [Candidatus Micrarchaeota archaeon]|nr:SIMPL domain-containing protein [Candidatus Micrarchaeota archaeon]
MGKEVCESCNSCCSNDDFTKKLALSGVAVVIVWLLISALGPNLGFTKTAQNIYVTSQPAKDTISVNGNAQTTVQPNMAVLSLGAETESNSAKEAQSDNAEIMDGVMTELNVFGISKEKIKTSTFYTEPVKEGSYKCPTSKPECETSEEVYKEVIVGYRTVHTIEAEVSDLNKVGSILDAATNSGANKINGVSFRLSPDKEKEIKKQLLTEAVKDAKDQAEKMANAAGINLGKATSLYESYYYNPTYYTSFAESKAIFAGTEVSSGSLDVSVSVSASFEIQ